MREINPLTVGVDLPDFALLDANEVLHSKANYLGKNYIVYFYPRASTPGCTLQACALRDNLSQINMPILGVSPDKPKALLNFINKQELNFTLLSDLEKEFAIACGIYGKKKFMGITRESIHRIAFLVDEQGKIKHCFRDFKAAEFAQEVMKVI